MKTADSKGMFDHMNTKNLTASEMEMMKKKKRKLNEVSNTTTVPSENKEAEFKLPAPVKKTA